MALKGFKRILKKKVASISLERIDIELIYLGLQSDQLTDLSRLVA